MLASRWNQHRMRIEAGKHTPIALTSPGAPSEVMVVGSDASSLVDWAVGFQQLVVERPLPRIGVHFGEVLYRDGDYYGREVNQAHRVAARAAGGEVIVTRPVVEAAGRHLAFRHIGDVRMKGFDESTELFLASSAGES